MCSLMSLKSSSVMPLSLSSGCTTSTSSGSKSCLLNLNNIEPINSEKTTKIYRNKKGFFLYIKYRWKKTANSKKTRRAISN